MLLCREAKKRVGWSWDRQWVEFERKEILETMEKRKGHGRRITAGERENLPAGHSWTEGSEF